MGSRSAGGVTLAAILIAAAWLALRNSADPAPPMTPATPPDVSETTSDAVRTASPPPPAARQQGEASPEWIAALSGREDSLVAAPGDAHAIVLRGRLTVRQRPWVHPANVAVRITKSFLDTVQPAEFGAEDELAPTRDDPETTTDAEGRFALRFAPAEGSLFLLIDHGGPWSDFQRVRDVPHAGGQLEIGEVYVDDRGGVVGRVIERGGRPVAKATVRGVDEPLLGIASAFGDTRDERLDGVEEFRASGATAFGPLPAWVVRRDRFLPFPTTTTDANGRFVLTGLRPGQQDVLILTEIAGRRRLQAVQVACGRMTDVGDVELQPMYMQRWDFVDEGQRPWVGAEVVPLAAPGFGPAPLRTDAQGSVTIPTPQTGRADLAFAFPGGGPWLRIPYTTSDTIVVRRPLATLVTLIDEHDEPIADGKVRFYAQGNLLRPADRALPGAMQPRPSKQGTHEGRAPDGIALAIVASAPGFAPAIATGTPGAQQVLRMMRLFEITVRTRGADGTPIADAVVRIQAHRNPEFAFVGSEWDLLANDRARVGRTDQNGELRAKVWDTFLSFSAEHPQFALGAGPRVRPRPNQAIDLMLRRNGSVHGTLLVHGTAAPPGFRIRARLRPPGAHELATSGWLGEASAVTGEGGEFLFASLDAGQWEFEPSPPPQPGAALRTEASTRYRTGVVSLEEGQDVWFRFEAEPSELDAPQLCGTIRVDGVPQTSARVRVRKARPLDAESVPRERRTNRRRPPRPAEAATAPVDSTWDQIFTTDAFGTFAFAGLLPETDYEVRFDLQVQDRLQFLRREVVRTPRASDPVAQRLDVEVRCGGLTVFASRQGRALANAMLRLRQSAGDGSDAACYEVLTDPHGQCTIESMPAGNWTIEPMHGGYCTPAEVMIEPGARPALQVLVQGS